MEHDYGQQRQDQRVRAIAGVVLAPGDLDRAEHDGAQPREQDGAAVGDTAVAKPRQSDDRADGADQDQHLRQRPRMPRRRRALADRQRVSNGRGSRAAASRFFWPVLPRQSDGSARRGPRRPARGGACGTVPGHDRDDALAATSPRTTRRARSMSHGMGVDPSATPPLLHATGRRTPEPHRRVPSAAAPMLALCPLSRHQRPPRRPSRPARASPAATCPDRTAWASTPPRCAPGCARSRACSSSASWSTCARLVRACTSSCAMAPARSPARCG